MKKELTIGDVLALGSFGAFALTIVYLFGYMITLGINVLPYFSLNDYLRVAIQWLPPAILGAVISNIAVQSLFPIGRGVTKAENDGGIITVVPTTNTRRGLKGLSLLTILFFIVTVAVTLFLETSSFIYILWALSAMMIWSLFFVWSYDRLSHLQYQWALLVIPPWVFLIFGLGLSSGGLKFSEAEFTLRGHTEVLVAQPLFLLDNYVVLRTQPGQVMVIPTAEVSQVLYPNRSKRP